MNGTILRALLTDAFYQVVDNKVFRLLLVLTLLPILLSFVIGFTDEGISILFGIKELSWEDLGRMFGDTSMPERSDTGEMLVQGFQSFWIEGLSGNFGILFCVAATAFFVPRMLEKGTADTIFSKPISRLLLLIARYMSGVIFVFILASFMIGGMHIGFLVASGYSDIGFLWGALTLTYIFALVHGFSTLVATFTRSAITAILCTLLFSLTTTTMHCVWIGAEQQQERSRLTEQTDDGTEEKEPEDEDGLSRVGKAFLNGVYFLHYVLPKTGDADYITKKLRRSIEGDPYALHDEDGGLIIEKHPLDRPEQGMEFARELEDNPLRFKATWTARADDGSVAASISLDRINRTFEFSSDGAELGDKRPKRLTAKKAADQALAELGERTDLASDPIKIRQRVGRQYANFVRWSTGSPEASTRHERIYLTFDNYLYQFDLVHDTSWMTMEDWDREVQIFLNGLSFPGLDAALSDDSNPWYESKFDWDAPLKFNIFFSIGTSLAFLALVLGISWLRLTKIDF